MRRSTNKSTYLFCSIKFFVFSPFLHQKLRMNFFFFSKITKMRTMIQWFILLSFVSVAITNGHTYTSPSQPRKTEINKYAHTNTDHCVLQKSRDTLRCKLAASEQFRCSMYVKRVDNSNIIVISTTVRRRCHHSQRLRFLF